MKEVLIVGVAGGSGSGKTTFVERLHEKFLNAHILLQDSYYIDQSSKFDFDGGAVNFDHPNSIDFPLMIEHLKELKRGNQINVPIYDFKTHKRLDSSELLIPKKVLFIDGILIFSNPELMKFMDFRIFIDCPENLRFERRLKRDVAQRGRTPEGVREQFFNQVKPMHDLFVDPSKNYASDVVTISNFDERLIFWENEIKSKI